MIDQLPEGKSIGWMQAPPQWIFTHTVRFMGIVRVVIQDGEGFILIKKGKPLVYFSNTGASNSAAGRHWTTSILTPSSNSTSANTRRKNLPRS